MCFLNAALDLNTFPQSLQGRAIPSRWLDSMWSLMAIPAPSFPQTVQILAWERPSDLGPKFDFARERKSDFICSAIWSLYLCSISSAAPSVSPGRPFNLSSSAIVRKESRFCLTVSKVSDSCVPSTYWVPGWVWNTWYIGKYMRGEAMTRLYVAFQITDLHFRNLMLRLSPDALLDYISKDAQKSDFWNVSVEPRDIISKISKHKT